MVTKVSTLKNPGVWYCEFIVSPVFPTCPVTGEPYAVEVTVKYPPAEDVIEYVAFEDWVRAWVPTRTFTIEELAAEVLAHATALLGEDVTVHVIVSILASTHCWATTTAHTEEAPV